MSDEIRLIDEEQVEVKRDQIFHYRTDVAGRVPEVTDLGYGEIAINYAAGYETLIIRNSNDEIATFPNRNILGTASYNVTASGNMAVLISATTSSTIQITDSMLKGQRLPIIIHNTGSSALTISLTGNYVVMGDVDSFTLGSSQYAYIDVSSDGSTNYLTLLSYVSENAATPAPPAPPGDDDEDEDEEDPTPPPEETSLKN